MSDIEQRLKDIEKRQRYILAALILDYLNREKIRATYEAVADTIGAGEPGVIAQEVKKYLPPLGRRSSWVVLKDTKEPGSGTPEDWHPDLHLTDDLIRTAEDLRKRLGWVDIPVVPGRRPPRR